MAEIANQNFNLLGHLALEYENIMLPQNVEIRLHTHIAAYPTSIESSGEPVQNLTNS